MLESVLKLEKLRVPRSERNFTEFRTLYGLYELL